MTTSMVDSARKWILAGLVVGVLGAAAVAADPCSDGSCGGACGNDWFDSSSCSNCIGDLDTTCCGDMTPFALCPGGRWYFQADAIALRRDAGQNEIFQTRNTNTFAIDPVGDTTGTLTKTSVVDTVLSTDDLDFQFAAGYRLLFGWRLADKYAIELSYFDLNDWDENAAVSDATPYAETVSDDGLTPPTVELDIYGNPVPDNIADNSLFSPFSNFGDPADAEVDYNSLAAIDYHSGLDNVELNVRRWLTTEPSRMAVSVLWGGRYNGIYERFGYYTESATTSHDVDVRTRNDLWAVQIGSQIDFCWDPGWHTEFEIKGGIAHNRAYQETYYQYVNGGTTNYWNRVDKDVTSWIGELRLTLVYQFGSHLTTHFGYEALMIANAALASRNFQTDRAILTDGPWMLNNGGTVVYHGPSAGLTFAW